ncbi:MAG TPA: FtsW/RodA/SpoVE family cell cycle protein, partial [Bacillales bacterium]|nr:FtsW/RodA/SpoVE family cell cycle protein [Bacillales bacterium]
LVPITGIPLPFISYGGSALVVCMFAMGILTNISMFVKWKSDQVQEDEQPVSNPAFNAGSYRTTNR